MAALTAALTTLPASRLADCATYVRRVLHVPAGARALLVNGQLVGPLRAGEPFGEDDFALLEKFTSSSYAGQLERKLLAAVERDVSEGV